MIHNALTIAGSDPSGGAGIQADLKTFSAVGVYGTTVITALTAQNTRGVTGIHHVPPDFVSQQFDTLVEDVRIDTAKIGMLGTADLAVTVADCLSRSRPPFVVLDPVMVATSGDRLLDEEAVSAVAALLPAVDVITPNLGEAALLTGTPPATTLAEMRTQAARLRDDLGAPQVLLKGGHLAGAAQDLWVDADGEDLLTAPRVQTRNTHGTGCSLSSALAGYAALTGGDWRAAARLAKAWLTAALQHADDLDVGTGHGPVHHFHAFWGERS